MNEQVQHAAAQYNDLAIAGMKINASTEWSNFSNFSAYLTEGIQVRRLIDDQGNSLADTGALQSTNLFPEIAYDLLTDKDRGAGEHWYQPSPPRADAAGCQVLQGQRVLLGRCH